MSDLREAIERYEKHHPGHACPECLEAILREHDARERTVGGWWDAGYATALREARQRIEALMPTSHAPEVLEQALEALVGPGEGVPDRGPGEGASS